FSWAYLRLDAGAGALLLFGSVQATMIGAGLATGHALAFTEGLGALVSVGGLVVLTAPGLTAPDPAAAMLRVAAGVGGGVHSLRGRGALEPLASNAANFARSVPLALVATSLLWRDVHASTPGLTLAVVSGAITSGLGYAIWYAALRGLTPARAAIVQ